MDYLSRTREDIFIGYCNLLSGSISNPYIEYFSSTNLLKPKFLLMFRKEYQRAKKELQLNGIQI